MDSQTSGRTSSVDRPEQVGGSRWRDRKRGNPNGGCVVSRDGPCVDPPNGGHGRGAGPSDGGAYGS